MQKKRLLPKIGFVVLWMVLSVLGWVAAAVAGSTFGMSNPLGFLSAGLIGGAAVGIFDWLVLRSKVNGAGWWILASSAGFGVALTLMGLVASGVSLISKSEPVIYTLTFAIVGVMAGIPQWFFLIRRSERSPWWLLASGLGWMVGWLAVLATNLVDSAPPAYFATIGALYGLVTALFLIYMGADGWKKKITPRPRR